MFIDSARIYIKAGDGGRGAVTFRREKHVPKGGPDGGTGGNGGNVIFEVSEGLKTLMDFRFKKHHKAKNGMPGSGGNRHGKNGSDLILKVPPGTVINNEEGNVLFDLVDKNEAYVAVKGGRGGRGNNSFATSIHKAPQFAEKGEPGEECWVGLELKLLADVGLVGMPNAGKSTIISVISAAKPKIADYPFTTITPNLGVVDHENNPFVVADIPGLIEGAHKGVGLGDAFLKHIDRAGILAHVLDLTKEDPVSDFEIINNELKQFSESLANRKQIIVGNKIDVVDSGKIKQIKKYFENKDLIFIAISAKTNKNIDSLKHILAKEVRHFPQIKEQELKVFTFKPEEKLMDYKIEKVDQNTFEIKGKAIERLIIMADLENKEALKYLQKRLDAIKVNEKLKEKGAKEGDTVRIAGFEFEFHNSD